jgi:predicted flavoprotein YhiN
MIDIAVIGAGPAGMMAAYAAGSGGRKVTVFEKNEKPGKKLYISGKGRCNITNASPDFFSNVVRTPKFLISAYNRLSNDGLISLLNKNGLATKVERGGRVFPASDKSAM